MPAESISANTASALASPSSFPIRFSPPGAKGWITGSSRTRWRWTGKGELQFDGSDNILRGRRSRALMPSAPQEIRFSSEDVLDVLTSDAAVRCRIKQPDGKPEPLVFWATDAKEAQAIASRWPKNRSVDFQEREAFNRTLHQVSARVVVTPALITINVLVFAAMVIVGVGSIQPGGDDLVRWGSNYGPMTLDGQWWRLFSSMFLHFGFIHLLLNMWALASLGPLTERLFGTARYLLLYLFAGLCGSITSLLWNPLVNSAGASGAIFGVLGGLLAFVLNPRTKVPATVSVAQRNSGLVFVAYNLMNGFTHAGIDNACHIGGLVGGFGMGWLLARPLEGEAREEEWRGLSVALSVAIAALIALSWPLTHPSPEKLATRQFRHDLKPFIDAESRAMKLTTQLEQLRSKGTISDEQWGRRILADVLPQWQEALDDVVTVQVPSQPRIAAVKEALLTYVQSRQLGVELSGEAARDHDKAKTDWARRVLQSSDAKANVAAKLLNANP